MILWCVIMPALLAGGGIALYRSGRTAKAGDRWACEGDLRVFFGVFFVVVAGLCWLAALIGTATITSVSLDADKKAALLPRKEAQREALIAAVRVELSNDQYAQLISITDPNAFVVFVQGTAVSDYLIARGGQIVALNAEVFALRNELDGQRIDVCNMLNNPFVPRLPFGNPDCKFRDEVAS